MFYLYSFSTISPWPFVNAIYWNFDRFYQDESTSEFAQARVKAYQAFGIIWNSLCHWMISCTKIWITIFKSHTSYVFCYGLSVSRYLKGFINLQNIDWYNCTQTKSTKKPLYAATKTRERFCFSKIVYPRAHLRADRWC